MKMRMALLLAAVAAVGASGCDTFYRDRDHGGYGHDHDRGDRGDHRDHGGDNGADRGGPDHH